MSADPVVEARARRPRLLVFLPLVGFVALAALFLVSLLRGGDPARVPSPLIGKPVPAFSLPALETDGTVRPGFSDADLRKGSVTLVNIFASWCVPCRDEHPILMQIAHDAELKDKGVRLTGIAYKDDPANSRRFIAEAGDPYAVIGVDRTGRVGIDWGVYGVPETFVVRGDGTIAYKFIGPLNPDAFATVLRPQILAAMR